MFVETVGNFPQRYDSYSVSTVCCPKKTSFFLSYHLVAIDSSKKIVKFLGNQSYMQNFVWGSAFLTPTLFNA